jgi:hypothetical protein
MSKIKMNKMKIKLMIKRKALIKGEMRVMRIIKNQNQSHHTPRVHQTVQRDHSVDNILGDIKNGVTTRSHVANFCQHYSFVSSMKSFKVENALRDPDWVEAVQEELNNFKRNQVWSLIERPKQNVVGIK